MPAWRSGAVKTRTTEMAATTAMIVMDRHSMQPQARTTTNAKRGPMAKELHIVGFRVGREVFGVPISLIHEIVRVPEITSVPDAPGYVQGVINLRGKIVSVVDLRRRFGEQDIKPSKKNRILVSELQGKLVGLIVASASE